MREYINKKKWEESELTRQTRLDGAKLYQNKKRSLETDLEKEKGFIRVVEIGKRIT